jgi:hypothetical protein
MYRCCGVTNQQAGMPLSQCQAAKRFLAAAAIAVLFAAPGLGGSQATSYPSMAPLEQYLMADRNSEIALARSAAPPAISKQATVLVLTRRGYETAVKGANGFVCLVDRAWQDPAFAEAEFWNQKIRAPTCLNPEAVRSVLPVAHKRTELALGGRSRTEIIDRIKAAYASKEFSPPDTGAMSYMMSKDQYLGDQFVHWHPHLMFYIPGTVEGADWGADVANSPVVLGPARLSDGTRKPINVFMVHVSQWSDGSPAPR